MGTGLWTGPRPRGYLHGHQLLHQHSVFEVQPLAVSPGLDVVAERVNVDALQLQHGQLDRGPVVLELLDVILQPLLIFLRKLRVAAAGCGAGRAEKEDKESPSHSKSLLTGLFPSLFSTPLLSNSIVDSSPGVGWGGWDHSSWHSKSIPPFGK